MNRPLFLAAWLILAVPLIWDGALYFSGLYQGAFALLRGLLVALALEVGTAALVLAFLAANPAALNPPKTTAEPPSPTGPIRGPDGKFKAKQE